MRWSDLTHPERAFALIARMLLALFVCIAAGSLLLSMLARMHFSIGANVGLLIALAFLSLGAYSIREQRTRRRRRPQRIRGAERTPLLPQRTEDE